MIDAATPLQNLAGEHRFPAFRLSRIGFAHLAVTALLLIAATLGVPLQGGATTASCCIVILVLGLPHGALDLLSLLETPAAALPTALYVMLAVLTGALWWAFPALALGSFFAVAIVHFGEDWAETRSPFIAYGAALATLAAPMLLHRAAIETLFTTIAVSPASTGLGDTLMLAAPGAIAAALVGFSMLWMSGRREHAMSGLAVLAGMIVLPPLIGFALFFCLFHSPRHFSAGILRYRGRHWRRWVPHVALATLGGCAIAGLLYALSGPMTFSAGALRTTFVTLSILTIPHMLLPHILLTARHWA